jgi:hypothetical protein
MNFECHQAIAVRLAVDLKLFDAITKRSSESEDGKVNVGQLSEDVKADPKLVGKTVPVRFSKSTLLLTKKKRKDHEVTRTIGYPQAAYF